MLAIIGDDKPSGGIAIGDRERIGNAGQAATIGEIEQELLLEVDEAGDGVDGEIFTQRPFHVRRVHLGVGFVAQRVIRLAAGNTQGGKGVDGAGTVAGTDAGRIETAVAICRVERIAIEIDQIFAVVAGVGGGDIPGEVFGQLELNRPAQTSEVDVIVAFAGLGVDHIAIVILIIARQLDLDHVAQRQINRAAHQLFPIGAISGFEETAERIGRPLHDDVDCAARCIAAEQGALRPAQHFNPVQIEKGEVVAVLPRHVDVIDIGADRRIEGGNGFGIAEAADIISVGGAEPGVVRPEQIGDVLNELERCRYAALRQQIG